MTANWLERLVQRLRPNRSAVDAALRSLQLTDGDLRVLLPDQDPQHPYARSEGLAAVGGSLEEVRFAPRRPTSLGIAAVDRGNGRWRLTLNSGANLTETELAELADLLARALLEEQRLP